MGQSDQHQMRQGDLGVPEQLQQLLMHRGRAYPVCLHRQTHSSVIDVISRPCGGCVERAFDQKAHHGRALVSQLVEQRSTSLVRQLQSYKRWLAALVRAKQCCFG